jgi:hypothetical protein
MVTENHTQNQKSICKILTAEPPVSGNIKKPLQAKSESQFNGLSILHGRLIGSGSPDLEYVMISNDATARQRIFHLFDLAGIGMDLITDDLQRHVTEVVKQSRVQFGELWPQHHVQKPTRLFDHYRGTSLPPI